METFMWIQDPPPSCMSATAVCAFVSFTERSRSFSGNFSTTPDDWTSEIDEVPPHPTHDPMLAVGRETVICATCELEVPWTPVRRGARAYCCEGCAVGGPCSCSYDDISGGGTGADPIPYL